MQSEATEVFEFHAKIPAFYSLLRFAAPLRKHSRRTFFSKSFPRKKVKNISEIGVE